MQGRRQGRIALEGNCLTLSTRGPKKNPPVRGEASRPGTTAHMESETAKMAQDTPAYRNPDLPVEERVEDLLSRMSIEEKASQMLNAAKAVERLGIPDYEWWNEGLHGVARAGAATVFPQAIALAATFNEELMLRVATAISDEGRAKHHEFDRHGDHGRYRGLTYWSPNINIFRDPRWGRGHETYGECPYLTGRMGVAFVKGLQGDDPKYLKLVATPKHYAVHSGPEPLRHEFDAVVSPKDLRETYLPAFRDCIKEGKAVSIMGAYNRTNGEPCCASKTLLQDILRDEWGFEGYVVSDCRAIRDIHEYHKVTDTPQESVALAVKNGCDLECGCVYECIDSTLEKGLMTEDDMDVALRRLFAARFRLGMFDPPERVAYAQIPFEVNDSPEHRELAAEAARQCVVLLKNQGGLLPLSKDIASVAVIGPNTDRLEVLRGNYAGTPSAYTTFIDGIRAKVSPQTKVWHAEGCLLAERGVKSGGFSEARIMAERADAVILCMGLAPCMEGEEGAVAASDGGGDRTDISLPTVQRELIEEIVQVGKPVVLVLSGGSAIAIGQAEHSVPAILDTWYPGEEGGAALADILFGDASPGGRLPLTFYRSTDDLPEFTDYDMTGRTYRFFQGEPLYPFGYGLGYTTFEYGEVRLSASEVAAGESLEIEVDVRNSGSRSGDEVVQLYLRDLEASTRTPRHELRGFRRLRLESSQSQTVRFTLTAHHMSLIDDAGKRMLEPGAFRLFVGGSQPDPRSVALAGAAPREADFAVTGQAMELEY